MDFLRLMNFPLWFDGNLGASPTNRTQPWIPCIFFHPAVDFMDSNDSSHGQILDLASGKRLQFANWKITIFKFGKPTISMGHFPVRTLQQITRGYKVSLEFQHAKRRTVSVSSRLISWFGRWSGPRMAETMDSSAAHQQAHLGQQTYPVQWETYVYGSGWE